MADFFGRLAGRAVSGDPVGLRPRVPSRFEREAPDRLDVRSVDMPGAGMAVRPVSPPYSEPSLAVSTDTPERDAQRVASRRTPAETVAHAGEAAQPGPPSEAPGPDGIATDRPVRRTSPVPDRTAHPVSAPETHQTETLQPVPGPARQGVLSDGGTLETRVFDPADPRPAPSESRSQRIDLADVLAALGEPPRSPEAGEAQSAEGVLLPTLPASRALSGKDDGPGTTDVRVTIERLEVHAAHPSTPERQTTPRTKGPRLTLEEYTARRNRELRGQR